MSPFDFAVEFILSEEGGYVNDLSDPGGETNFGISKRSYPNEDIGNLTRERAKEIYKTDYWDKCGCGDFPVGIAFCVFDCAVNQGVVYACRSLQYQVGAHVDGIVGPMTKRAVKYKCTSNIVQERLIKYFTAERILRYAANSNFKRYGRGWCSRAVNSAMNAVILMERAA